MNLGSEPGWFAQPRAQAGHLNRCVGMALSQDLLQLWPCAIVVSINGGPAFFQRSVLLWFGGNWLGNTEICLCQTGTVHSVHMGGWGMGAYFRGMGLTLQHRGLERTIIHWSELSMWKIPDSVSCISGSRVEKDFCWVT